MRLTGTLVRLGRTLAVDGDVSQQPDGSWAGTLTFSRADAPTVVPGPATIKTEAGQTWDVFISSTHTTMESLRGASAFRVLRGIA